jgi:hypothetical protein
MASLGILVLGGTVVIYVLMVFACVALGVEAEAALPTFLTGMALGGALIITHFAFLFWDHLG